jgi:hypothetical protein
MEFQDSFGIPIKFHAIHGIPKVISNKSREFHRNLKQYVQ